MHEVVNLWKGNWGPSKGVNDIDWGVGGAASDARLFLRQLMMQRTKARSRLQRHAATLCCST